MKIGILGTYCTKFGELWDKNLEDLLAEAMLGVIKNSNITTKDINEIFVGNMCSGLFANQLNLGAMATEILGIHVASTVVEGACASGSVALRAGIQAIESGSAKIVLVVGAEKMTDVDTATFTAGLSSAASEEWEQLHGVTFPGVFGLISRAYMNKYGLTRKQMASSSVRNHKNGVLNPIAHIRKKITIDNVINAPMVADPLTLLDCSPISDGAAAIILCSPEIAEQNKKNVFIIGSGQASDTLCISKRTTLTSLHATKIAAQNAYKQANCKPENIDVAEVHDGFSIAEIIGLEDLGFCKPGTAGKEIESGNTDLNSKISINPSGGLKSKGHPVGATGIAQAVEIVNQLDGTCKERQVKNATIGLTHNVGGSGSTVCVHVLKKMSTK